MDLFSWLLTFIVVIYGALLIIKTGKPLYRYNKVKDRTIEVDGEICSFYGEEVMKRNGNKVSSFYPVYSCKIDEEERTLNGVVRYVGTGCAFVGQHVVLLYDKETKELWNKKDLPLMKKQVIFRAVTLLALVVIMILTTVML